MGPGGVVGRVEVVQCTVEDLCLVPRVTGRRRYLLLPEGGSSGESGCDEQGRAHGGG